MIVTTRVPESRPEALPAARLNAARAGGNRRPLFLNPALRGQIDADGPALRLCAEHRANTRYPLDRVSRIIAGARLNWGAGALSACLERAIPIVITRMDGSPVGSMLPAHLHALPLAAAREELLCCPDWRDIHHRWQRAERMRMLDDWRRAQQAAGTAPDRDAFRNMIRRHVYRGAAAVREPQGFWQGALYALAVETIRRWGVPPVVWGDVGDALDLRRELAALLELRWMLEVRDGMAAALADEAMALAVFHALTEKLEAEAWRIMQSLARRTNQVLNEWR